MKKGYLFIGLLVSYAISFAQATNIFPDNGNVGIGTISPLYKLDLSGSLHFGGTGTYTSLLLGTESTPILGYNQTSYLIPTTVPGSGQARTVFRFKSNEEYSGKNLLDVIIDGGLGIGNINPGAKLDITSNSYLPVLPGSGLGTMHIRPVDNSTGQLTGITFGANQAQINTAQAGIYVQSSGSYGTKMYFGTTDSYAYGVKKQMIIDHLGDVGIGTIDPGGYKLAVNGKIRAQEIKVEAIGWPDYVFLKDYKLPTLEETERHITEKGYLPGIPSAEEVKTNGIDLGEMNAKLLQKIEELTLYIINQESRIKRLESDRNINTNNKNNKK